MKINAATIFGLCVGAAGLLFLLFAILRGGGSSTPDTAATSSGWGYYGVGIGILLSGAAIALAGQLFRRSPKPTDRL